GEARGWPGGQTSRVGPSRSASSASSTTPAWLQIPWASAATSNWGRVLVACTGRVTLLARGWDVKQSHPPWSGGSLLPSTNQFSAHAKYRGQQPRNHESRVPNLRCLY